MADEQQRLISYDELMAAGRAALAQGDKRLAHHYWRWAAMADPYSEEVWLALLDVVETPADREACLANVVAINPLNADARSLLRREKTESKPKPPQPKQTQPQPPQSQPPQPQPPQPKPSQPKQTQPQPPQKAGTATKPKLPPKYPLANVAPTFSLAEYHLMRLRLSLLWHGVVTGVAIGIFGILLSVLITVLLQFT